MQALLDLLNLEQRQVFTSFKTPADIQNFLDSIPYSPEDRNRCPLNVVRDRQAHCLDGALFGAAALRYLGFPAQLIDMFPDPGMDDDHVLAIYRRGKYLGAVAKSNFSGLRFREAVYRSPRELVMSYFEDFFNSNGVKTMRTYTPILNLDKLDDVQWMTTDAGANAVEKWLLSLRRFPVITPEMTAGLSTVDQRSYEAGMLGVNKDGLYKPRG
jgi:hypothetical protein